ncbi:hypothetical protein BDC45DRAFT_413478, partial [Circinella umbellata]
NNGCLEQPLQITLVEAVEEDIDQLQIGTAIGADVVSMDEVIQKTISEEGGVGPQPSTATVTSTTPTVPHQRTTQ